ncbi:hypothetical protein V1227_09465 [Lentzea sp. DG1S-22]|uniref:hypothetical protein n=1 Tax=Lentzea sp. DG1S-22 TaxID=3108822 RepID=UPI002E7986BB|nr:hypothetical protein [Lentzea sp. DG1S-22]WVH82958.1 hypothetical protein V1227_09465 [Lentzea sp. DG1S-22]
MIIIFIAGASSPGRVEQAHGAEEQFRGKLADAVDRTRGTGQTSKKVLLMYGSKAQPAADDHDARHGFALAAVQRPGKRL